MWVYPALNLGLRGTHVSKARRGARNLSYRVSGKTLFIPFGGPNAHDVSGRDDNRDGWCCVRRSSGDGRTADSSASPEFPVKSCMTGKMHAPLSTESRIRGRY